MTGGTERHKLVGQDQFLMVFFISVYPDADADEVATYIVNNGGNVYDRQTISKRLQELGFTRKRASTEVYQAFLPHNILRVQQFWTLVYLLQWVWQMCVAECWSTSMSVASP